MVFLVFLVSLVFLFFLGFLVFLVSLVFLVFLVPVLCSSVPLQPSPNKRAQAPADSIEFPMGSKETLARNWSFHFSQVNYISLFIFVVDRDLSRNSCFTHATTVLSDANKHNLPAHPPTTHRQVAQRNQIPRQVAQRNTTPPAPLVSGSVRPN